MGVNKIKVAHSNQLLTNNHDGLKYLIYIFLILYILKQLSKCVSHTSVFLNDFDILLNEVNQHGSFLNTYTVKGELNKQRFYI